MFCRWKQVSGYSQETMLRRCPTTKTVRSRLPSAHGRRKMPFLAEDTFLRDAAQERLYVTISADGVICTTSDAPDAPADVPPVLTLSVLDEIDAGIAAGTSGPLLPAVQMAARLLDWGVNTGPGADKIGAAASASAWLAAKTILCDRSPAKAGAGGRRLQKAADR